MDNFTPLKFNNRSKNNKFLIFASLFLVVLSIGLPVFFLSNQNRKIVTDEKAIEISKPTKIPISIKTPTTSVPTIIPTEEPVIIATEEPTIIPTMITPTEASISAPTVTPNLTITP